jgi:hypothetical protein
MRPSEKAAGQAHEKDISMKIWPPNVPVRHAVEKQAVSQPVRIKNEYFEVPY